MTAAKTVLVVDDNQNIRIGLRHLLETVANVSVCGEASDGIEAVLMAVQKQPDLILMDLSMPNMNGVAAASAIRRLLPQTRIVMFTLFADAINRSEGRLAGVDLVVSKSNGTGALLEAIQPFLNATNVH